MDTFPIINEPTPKPAKPQSNTKLTDMSSEIDDILSEFNLDLGTSTPSHQQEETTPPPTDSLSINKPPQFLTTTPKSDQGNNTSSHHNSSANSLKNPNSLPKSVHTSSNHQNEEKPSMEFDEDLEHHLVEDIIKSNSKVQMREIEEVLKNK